jgi:hypothetical protein
VKRQAALVLVGFLSLACVRDVTARFPGNLRPGEVPAELELRFTSSVSGAHVAVNGTLVVADERTDRIVITDLPPGPTSIIVAVEGEVQEKVFSLNLEAGRRIVVPLATVASGGAGSLIVQTLVSVLVNGAYIALRSLL